MKIIWLLLAFPAFFLGLGAGCATRAPLFAPSGEPGRAPASPETRFEQTGAYRFDDKGGWDYLVAEGGLLYVGRQDRLMVTRLDGRRIGDIANKGFIHGVALDPAGKTGYFSNGTANKVVSFDLESLKIKEEYEVGKNPDAILFDAFSSRVFAFNGRSKSVSVIDPKTRQVSEIPLAGKPEFAASDHSGRVYVNIEDLSQVAVIDATMVAVVKMLNLAPCQEPTGLSMDVAARRLFVGCGNKKMVVLDPDANRVVAEFDVGKGVDATAFDARRKLVFVSAGEGSLAVIRENSPDDFKLAQVVSTMKGGRTMAVDEQSGRVYVVSAEFLPPPPKPLPRPPHPAMTPGTFQILEFSDRSGN